MDFTVKPRINVSESKQNIPLCNVLFVMLKILNFVIMFVLGLVSLVGIRALKRRQASCGKL
jgi:hypothetical protein